jgi:hypothetical protein
MVPEKFASSGRQGKHLVEGVFSEVGRQRRVGTLMMWHGVRFSANPPLPSQQELSKRLESIVVLKTIALCSNQMMPITERGARCRLPPIYVLIHGAGPLQILETIPGI